MNERDTVATAAEHEVEQSGTTRRRGIGAGLKLAFAAPAVLAALPVGVASADSDSDSETRRRDGAVRGDDDTSSRLGHTTLFSNLCRVGMVPAADFTPAVAGTDRLRGGWVRVFSAHGDHDDRVVVRLRGAEPNAAYQVYFVRFGDRGRELLGEVRTDRNGDVRREVDDLALAAGVHGRVGIFVLVRNGADQFVSCAEPDHHR